MVERAMKAAEENAGRETIGLHRYLQGSGVEAKIGPVVVVGKLPEIFDRHRFVLSKSDWMIA
jgi:hypothetical protein